ncbi:unnamed protein product [Macrosiphum euphorbiae]|uniref:BACK domain-containing protein n=1 Tax=Macrosiphum euphorbiae TaxID=13131 RepID=A0AAV0WWN8_9HEMI|nr:unnamed protein product [Macrosiphum euphorbiae]
MDLLPASILLQLDYVKDVCIEFLKRQLNLSNCLGIKEFSDFYNCTELFSSAEEYIKTHFLKFMETDEFLSLSSEEVINLISCNDINVPFEEKIFECVITWVKHELDCRYDNLPKLMEHVRLSLAPQEYISLKVDEEPLIKNNPKCKDFVNEALNFHIVKKHRHIPMPQTIRNSPRQTGLKFLLAMCDSSGMGNCYTSCFYGVGVINDRIYAVGGDIIGDSQLTSAEVFDVSVQEWRMLPNMSTGRMNLGVGVLNNLLYVVGGYKYPFALKSVECYDPILNIWIPVTQMSTNRRGPGIGVLDGVIYAIGGDCQEYDNSLYLKSVEAYSPITKVWTSIANMHLCRSDPRVVTFNENNLRYDFTLFSTENDLSVGQLLICVHSNLKEISM